ncbi:MAG: glutamate--tRNA ligase [Bdellovibrionota bacterium]
MSRSRNEQMARREAPGYSGYCRTRNVPADTPHVVRFKMPAKPNVSAVDAVKGRVSWDSIPLKDPVILKSDGYPTYHLAVVVDDHHMKITHAMRGDEWIASFPLHLLLYAALGWEAPIFAHLPVILATDGKKLSKRHGSVAVDQFEKDGYLPEALLNYTMLVGWSPGDGNEQEIFSIDELKEIFSLERVNNSSGVFDYDKLQWMNGQYIRKLNNQKFTELAMPYFEQAGIKIDSKRWDLIAPSIKERVKMIAEVPETVECLFVDKIKRELPEMFGNKFSKEDALISLEKAQAAIQDISEFTVENLDGTLKALANELGYKVGSMFVCLRIAVLGKKATPPLFESFVALGKTETLNRIAEAAQEVKALQP